MFHDVFSGLFFLNLVRFLHMHYDFQICVCEFLYVFWGGALSLLFPYFVLYLFSFYLIISSISILGAYLNPNERGRVWI